MMSGYEITAITNELSVGRWHAQGTSGTGRNGACAGLSSCAMLNLRDWPIERILRCLFRVETWRMRVLVEIRGGY